MRDGEACFAFHKAYKDYADPREGEAGVTWQQADGKPFRKSMWAGSAEASLGGRVARIAIPAEVVLGCRNIKLRQLNGGMAILSVLLVTRFFDSGFGSR